MYVDLHKHRLLVSKFDSMKADAARHFSPDCPRTEEWYQANKVLEQKLERFYENDLYHKSVKIARRYPEGSSDKEFFEVPRIYDEIEKLRAVADIENMRVEAPAEFAEHAQRLTEMVTSLFG
jgi:hypothetical protein